MALQLSVASDATGGSNSMFCEDLQKPVGHIFTGVGYLDHMLDQFNSHAQIGLSMTIGNENNNDNLEENRNRHAAKDQGQLMTTVGKLLGTELQRLLRNSPTTGTKSRFCCPLDEALVACELTFDRESCSNSGGKLIAFSLAPYGKYPSSGRKLIGTMETDKLQIFWETVAEYSGLMISIVKLRGNNAHHIVESTFKAFSRALRNLLDGMDTGGDDSNGDADKTTNDLYAPNSDNWIASVQLARHSTVQRSTKETIILVDVRMDGATNGCSIDTGIKTLDEFLLTLATHAAMSLKVQCKGDLWIDEHHTAEDVSIAIGQVLNEAFGTKAGLNRMWNCAATVNESTHVEVTMDLSNRPSFHHNLMLDTTEMVGDLSMEMLEHVLDSLVVNAKMTVHIVQTKASSSDGGCADTLQAVAVAFGEALKRCAMVDCRRAGATASSKGTLSV